MLSTQRLTVGAGAMVRFGVGTLAELPSIVTSLGQRRAFLITDRGLVVAGVRAEAERVLQAEGIETGSFDGVHPNPSTETLTSGSLALRSFGPTTVIALGGGSVLDAAKGIALMAVNDGPARSFDYRIEPANPGLPMVAIPTTAGTGSETNSFGVIDDIEAQQKFYVGHASVLPRVVILDPLLTTGLPADTTAATGMDVLAHALEALSSSGSNPYSEGICLQVVNMVSRFLPRAVADGQDIEARSQMLLAAHMAGLAFATTGLGMAHAIAHAMSARMGAAHGVALSVLLPHVLAFNLPVRTKAYGQVAGAMGVANSTGHSNAEAAVQSIRQLSLDVGMPATLHEIGCTAQLIPSLVETALADEVIGNTPRLPSAQELHALLEAAL
jgi:alcohol dehydrogenase